MNLIDEITDADEQLRQAETETAEASRTLRQCKRRLRERRLELSRLIQELRTGQSRVPLLERIAPNGDRLSPSGIPLATADEHQRGPTTFPQRTTDLPLPTHPPAKGPRSRKGAKTAEAMP
jgi:hypothetical protein